jgi:hypothetical protein
MLIDLGGWQGRTLDRCQVIVLVIEPENSEKLACIVFHQNNFGESNQSILSLLK